jgi:hypothetical protein
LAQHGQLERLADEARVLDRLDRDLADDGAPLRAHLDQAGLGELDERLAHRCPADAQLLRDLLLRERLPGLELKSHDGVPESGKGLRAGGGRPAHLGDGRVATPGRLGGAQHEHRLAYQNSLDNWRTRMLSGLQR